jgi:hypothetical protein
MDGNGAVSTDKLPDDSTDTTTEMHPRSADAGTEGTDRLGRRYRHDGKGRFAKLNGNGTSAAAARLAVDKQMLPGIDARSATFQRYREIAAQLTSDQGDPGKLSAARAQLIKRFAGASVLAEAMESRISAGEAVSIAEYAALSSTLVRLSNKIGTSRIAKDAGPTLGELLRAGIERDSDAAEQRLRERQQRDGSTP